MDTGTISAAKTNLVSFSELQNLSTFYDSSGGAAQDGVAVTSFGRGQVTGVTYTVPAHGEIEYDFDLRIPCVTPEGVKALNALIRSLLDASEYHQFDELQKTEISGGLSLFAFFSFGAKASYSDTKHTMEGWGLSEENQARIVTEMLKLTSEPNRFKVKGIIRNDKYDYSVSGNIFAIVMDATVQQSEEHKQLRFLAPNMQLVGQGGGPTLPDVGQLYPRT